MYILAPTEESLKSRSTRSIYLIYVSIHHARFYLHDYDLRFFVFQLLLFTCRCRLHLVRFDAMIELQSSMIVVRCELDFLNNQTKIGEKKI